MYLCLTTKGKKINKTKKQKDMKKTHNNTMMICITLGLLTGSLLAGLMINQDWFVLSVILFLALGIFYTSHGEEKILLAKDNKDL